jgi:hypothetical protein
MSSTPPQGGDPPPGDWAPSDYTDGKEKGEWESKYPPKARKGIFWETVYLVSLFVIYLIAAFWLLYQSLFATHSQGPDYADSSQKMSMWWGFIAAWVGGSLGGCSFAIKWLYHIVAKLRWHEDRRLWRILTPHLSGVVSLFMVLLVSSNLLQLFEKDFVARPIGVLAFSFLVGYFSDKALAKMAEVADTLFGSSHNSK